MLPGEKVVKEFKLVFYRKPNGDCPVSEFLSSLNKVMRFKMMNQFDLLELFGNHPKGDFTKPLGDGIFEVRAQNRTDITRVLFFFDKNRQIVLTNGFVKKTQRLPASELETAKRYRADYLYQTRNSGTKQSDVNEHLTSGPQWRPALDDIVSAAEAKTRSGKKSKNRSKDCRGK